MWASLAAVIAIGRWDEMSTGPDITVDVLVPATAVLVPAIVLNLVVIARQPVHTVAGQRRQLIPAD